MSDNITPTSIQTGHAFQNSTLEAADLYKQGEIITRIMHLEHEFDNYKRKGLSPTLERRTHVSPGFSVCDKSLSGINHAVSEKREISTSAVRHSLEHRTNSNGMKVVRSQALRGVMDISFTSDDEDDRVSDRYFDTAKNKHKSLERHNDQ
jgi:hypothetical protein